ncbi:alanine racemase [Paracoccaceae bacterium]|nr:alanine racemase [Paracoccaceae bacterium]
MSPELHINLANLQSNIRFYSRITKSNVELSAVVKSDAYGLGISKLVPAIEKYGIKIFFTATLSEAIKVRKYSAHSEIFTLNGFDFQRADLYREFGITPVINNLIEAKKFFEIFHNSYKTALQINTGMNRLGFNKKTFFEHIDVINSLPVNLILSHLACADDIPNKENKVQRDLFLELCKNLPNIRKSISASHGTILGSEFHFDMVRLGIGLYGGIKNDGLKQVIQIKVPVLQNFVIDKNMQVGYNFTYKAPKTMKVATLAMGYADGLPRILSNKGKLFSGNRSCPIIGRISMDLVTVDISSLPDTPDYLTVFSPEYQVDNFAKDCQTISHEVLVSLGERIKRVYSE